ncbi:hypothetical protein CFC21_040438 [Triticum aestivum]|uniref:Uncharacterized protein n=3 Tax=Triticum aestivum TaxID=4565 RepID=A0A9R1JT61_WHEAT|nr:uncharacterized protein LOC119281021 [Triticum dicoccoides]XP_044344381.1 uncharacterized protein LOC123065079 isoform X2 [Triticum aestivum]KAF7028537.1 hypothetical protein CFC21_040438 [Triticum aestivum]
MELSMKLMIDTKSQKVCFAEAGSDVVEFLTGLLSLPLGTALDLLTKERLVGSISNVLNSVEKLDANYKSKMRCLSPAVNPAALPLLQQLLDTQLSNGDTYTCGACGYLSAIDDRVCPRCKCYMRRAMTVAAGKNGTTPVPVGMYTVGDDLSVTSASFFATISLLGIKDLSALQEKTVKIGKEEALEIFAASLKSKTVLSDVFLPKKNARLKREHPEGVIHI